MNETFYTPFDKDLNLIRIYLNYLDKVDALIRPIQDFDSYQSPHDFKDEKKWEAFNELCEVLQTFKNQHIDNGFREARRIFEYKSIIISLYGLLEK